jgi:hypothetical protein
MRVPSRSRFAFGVVDGYASDSAYLAAVTSIPKDGDVYYNTSESRYRYWSGSGFQPLGAASGPRVRYVDSTSTTLPATEPYSPDGTAIADGDKVLFTNLSTPSQNNRVYRAAVASPNITWTLLALGEDASGAPTDGDSLYVQEGTASGDQVWFFNGLAWYSLNSYFGGLFATKELDNLTTTAINADLTFAILSGNLAGQAGIGQTGGSVTVIGGDGDGVNSQAYGDLITLNDQPNPGDTITVTFPGPVVDLFTYVVGPTIDPNEIEIGVDVNATAVNTFNVLSAFYFTGDQLVVSIASVYFPQDTIRLTAGVTWPGPTGNGIKLETTAVGPPPPGWLELGHLDLSGFFTGGDTAYGGGVATLQGGSGGDVGSQGAFVAANGGSGDGSGGSLALQGGFGPAGVGGNIDMISGQSSAGFAGGNTSVQGGNNPFGTTGAFLIARGADTDATGGSADVRGGFGLGSTDGGDVLLRGGTTNAGNVQAFGHYLFSGNPSDGDTITVTISSHSEIFTFRNTPTLDNEIEIDATPDNTVENAEQAIAAVFAVYELVAFHDASLSLKITAGYGFPGATANSSLRLEFSSAAISTAEVDGSGFATNGVTGDETVGAEIILEGAYGAGPGANSRWSAGDAGGTDQYGGGITLRLGRNRGNPDNGNFIAGPPFVISAPAKQIFGPSGSALSPRNDILRIQPMGNTGAQDTLVNASLGYEGSYHFKLNALNLTVGGYEIVAGATPGSNVVGTIFRIMGSDANGTNQAGGTLSLRAGRATGNGESTLDFYSVRPGQGSGTTVRDPAIAAQIAGQNEFRFYEVGALNYVGLRAPTSTTSYAVSLPATAPSTGQALVATSSTATAWQTPGTPVSAYKAENVGLSTTPAAGALVVNLRQADGSSAPTTGGGAVRFGFRDDTIGTGAVIERTVTAALGVTIDSGATLGLQSGVDQFIYVYAIDAFNIVGLVELAVSASNQWDERELYTTTTLTSGATSATTLYSNAARTDVPIRLIGRLVVNETSIGTWTVAAVEIYVGNVFPPSTGGGGGGWPNESVTDETELAAAISTLTSGGVILVAEPFSVTTAIQLQPGQILVGRGGFSVITIDTGGSIEMLDECEMQNCWFETTLTSSTLVTMSGVAATMERCHFDVEPTDTIICVDITGSANLVHRGIFVGAFGGSSVGVQGDGVSDNVAVDCVAM